MKRYNNYKESGVEWIGEIPEHWNRLRIKGLVSIKVTDGPHETPQLQTEGIPFISAEAIKGNQIDLDYKRGYISLEQHEEYSKKSKVEKGDILFCKYGSTTGKSAYVDTDVDFGIWSPLAIIRADKIKVNDKYLFQSIQSDMFRRQVETSWTFGTQPNIGMGSIENLWVAIPPLEEQTQIANYLNHKTAQLDTLIAKKEQLISLLQEERTAMINQAVTKGLDRNVPMKISGIELVGEIPEHWEAKNIKYVASLRSGDNIISEQINSEGSYPVYGGNGLRGYYSEYTNDGNYILIGRQGALCGNIKYASDKFWASEHAIVCYLNSNHNWIWFGKLLEAMDLNQYNQSAAQPGLAVGLIKNLKIPVPSFEEQLRIVDFIADFEKETDSLMNKYEQEIDLLREYKTALISEVVTGKVDVREEVLN
ncbi:restriction endonuclease subunit S [Gelidibacter sp.]|uniref:restriction endonuclease subunit S n=1 Tax=Gelidibacter sp. TaxID=2018083 RepID=UPI003266F072